MHTPAEVDELDHPSRSHEYVLRLDISVDHAVGMQVADGCAQLRDVADYCFPVYFAAGPLERHEGVESLPACVLLEQVHCGLVREDAVEFGDVMVAAEGLDFYLREQSLEVALLLEHLSFDHLQRVGSPSLLFEGQKHRAVCALAQLLNQVELVQTAASPLRSNRMFHDPAEFPLQGPQTQLCLLCVGLADG